MKHKQSISTLGRAGAVLFVSVALSSAFIWPAYGGPVDSQGAAQRKQYQEELAQVQKDRTTYIERIVQRWEAAARQSRRWDENWYVNLFNALGNLSPDNLVAANKAQSYEEMLGVLANGPQQTQTVVPLATAQDSLAAQSNAVVSPALGQFGADQVYTPVPPCRIVDTRFAGGPIAANTTRLFDVDGSNFTAQGGFNGSCGVPFGVASAVAMTITAVAPSVGGYFKAWALGAQPVASVLNFGAGQTIANTTIVPVAPGGGNDFSVWSSVTSHLVVSVVGYFAAPAATALDCITVTSDVTAIGVNVWTPVDAVCPAGRTVTGGGHNVPEGTLGRPGVWVDTIPSGNGWRTWVDNQTDGNRNVQTFAVCCRVPGR
jgi:hypothetical protein